MSPQVPSQTASSRDAAPELGPALERGLGQPISALRACMESLAREFDGHDPRSAALGEALSEVTRLGHNVGDLLDFAYPPQPRPLECTIEEILYSARFQLPHTLWGHLLIARDASPQLPRIFIDGPVLAQSIARLVKATVADAVPGSGLMLRAQIEAGRVHFTITVQGANDPHRRQADPTGLCHSIAQRDLGVIGCALDERTTQGGAATFRIQLPHDALVFEELAA